MDDALSGFCMFVKIALVIIDHARRRTQVPGNARCAVGSESTDCFRRARKCTPTFTFDFKPTHVLRPAVKEIPHDGVLAIKVIAPQSPEHGRRVGCPPLTSLSFDRWKEHDP
jgi:hypothetical protein